MLVAEDDPEIAQPLGDFLVVEGFQVRSTPNPGEAVAALASNGIECVVANLETCHADHEERQLRPCPLIPSPP